MKRLLIYILMLGTFKLSASDISQDSKPATLRVVVEKMVPATFLEVSGRHHIYNPLDGSLLSRGMLSKKHTVTLEDYGLNWGEKIPTITQMRIVPLDSQTRILINGIQYKGCLEIHAYEGKINVISEVDVENFLKTTLPSHIDPSLDPELLNALAIVARTHAYYIAAKNKNNSFDLDGTTFNYPGNLLSARVDTIDKAIETTRHAVLTFKGKLFPATWTEDSAGKTAAFSTIFRKTALTPPAIQVPLATKNLDSRKWQFTVSKDVLARLTYLDNLTGLDLFIDHDSNKVYGVKLTSSLETKEIDFLSFQKLIGKHNICSNHFTLSCKGNEMTFTGYGEGLGVGLCLYTGHLLAEKGKTAPEILDVFFPGTELHKARSLEELCQSK
jgi:stage II sporulation protein D